MGGRRSSRGECARRSPSAFDRGASCEGDVVRPGVCRRGPPRRGSASRPRAGALDFARCCGHKRDLHLRSSDSRWLTFSRHFPFRSGGRTDFRRRRAGRADEAPSVPEVRPGVLKGYLAKEAIPDSAALLPPPPGVGSTAAALDQEVARANLALRGHRSLAARRHGRGPPVSRGRRRIRLRARRAGFGTGHAAALPDAATDHGRRGVRDLRRKGQVPARASVHARRAADLHSRQGTESQGAGLLSVRPHLDRVGMGARARRGIAGGEHGDPGSRPRLRRKPARLQRSLAKRCDRGPVHRRGDGGAACTTSGFLADLAAARTELPPRAPRRLPPQRDCAFEAKALAKAPPQSP